MSTILDIVEQCCVLIVFSLQQMNTIHTKLDMIPDRVLITCEALGRHHAQAAQSSSSHIATDLIAMHGALARLRVQPPLVRVIIIVYLLVTVS